MVKGGARGSLSRKELRKAHKQAAKEKKQQRHNLKQQVREKIDTVTVESRCSLCLLRCTCCAALC